MSHIWKSLVEKKLITPTAKFCSLLMWVKGTEDFPQNVKQNHFSNHHRTLMPRCCHLYSYPVCSPIEINWTTVEYFTTYCKGIELALMKIPEAIFQSHSRKNCCRMKQLARKQIVTLYRFKKKSKKYYIICQCASSLCILILVDHELTWIFAQNNSG